MSIDMDEVMGEGCQRDQGGVGVGGERRHPGLQVASGRTHQHLVDQREGVVEAHHGGGFGHLSQETAGEDGRWATSSSPRLRPFRAGRETEQLQMK